jgi:hypothetical protein
MLLVTAKPFGDFRMDPLRTPIALRIRGNLTTEGQDMYSIVKVQRGLVALVPMKCDWVCSCGHPLSEANPSKSMEHPSPVKKHHCPQFHITFHKPTFFTPDSSNHSTSTFTISSFHTTANTTSWPYGPVQAAGNSEAVKAFCKHAWPGKETYPEPVLNAMFKLLVVMAIGKPGLDSTKSEMSGSSDGHAGASTSTKY